MWNPKCEAMPQEKLARIQFLRLKQTLEALYQLVPHYRQRFREAGAEPGDIRSLEDMAGLPFTTKDDLRDNYPFGLFTNGLNDVVRIHSSSGTHRAAHGGGLYRDDLETWAELMAAPSRRRGAPTRVVHIAYGYGLLPEAWESITVRRRSALWWCPFRGPDEAAGYG